MKALERIAAYYVRVLVSLDQLGNTLLNGNPDETISSRVGRNAIQGDRWALVAEFVINLLFFWMKDENGNRDHCRSCIEQVQRR